MTILQILPLIAYGFTIIIVTSAISRKSGLTQSVWMLPAALCLAFTAFSVLTIVQEGLLGFWPNHSETYWGNQVWFDLLLGIGTAFILLLPKARSLGINALPWGILTGLTGCIGLLAFFARILFLQGRKIV